MTPFDTRYFSVLLYDNGTVSIIDTGKIASVTTEQASEYATTLFEAGKVYFNRFDSIAERLKNHLLSKKAKSGIGKSWLYDQASEKWPIWFYVYR